MDVVEIDAASNNGVENVRALREEAVFSPASVKKRVYIIDEVHMLSTSAFNALLKILEEPPEHLVFILATTEIQKVLPTILSRCQRYSFKRISPKAIADRLEYVAKREEISLERDAATLLARLADGSLRDGLSLLDQCSGVERITAEHVLSAMGLAGSFRIAELLQSIAAGDTAAAVSLFESLWRDGKSPATLLGELNALLRDIMLLAVAPNGGTQLLSGGFDDKTLASLKAILKPSAAMEYISIIQESIGKLRDGRDPRIEAELCIIGLCEPKLLDTPERLGMRITKLEKALAEGSFISAPPAPLPVMESPETEKPEEAEGAPGAAFSEEAEADEPPFDMPNEKKVSETDIEFSGYDTESAEAPSELESDDHAEAVTDEPPEPESATTDDSGDIWPALCAELKRTMPPFHLAHLSGAQGELDGDKLVISVAGAFAKNSLEKPEPQELIREAVTKLTGRVMPIKIEEKKASPEAAERLDKLSQFRNVKFE
jgi:DNA polymerase-3 subunit gamma/tau